MKTKGSSLKTLEQTSQEMIDKMIDASYLLAPVLKIVFIGGMVFINYQMGSALSHGDSVFPILCGTLDLGLLWFWNKSESVELSAGQRRMCGVWALFLLALTMLSGYAYACSLDAMARTVTNPHVAVLKSQLDSAISLFEGMESGSAEKAFGGDPIASLRNDYLAEHKKYSHDLGYAPIHAAFYVTPYVNTRPEFYMGFVRALFVVAIMGSGLGFAYFGGGIGQARRLGVATHRTIPVIEGQGKGKGKGKALEGEYLPGDED